MSIKTAVSLLWGMHRYFSTQFPFSMYRQFMQLMIDINLEELLSAEHFRKYLQFTSSGKIYEKETFPFVF